MPKTAGIILIGNEILSGKITDANAAYLCRELRALGVDVRRISVIPDEVDLIAREVATLSRDHDVVFTSGGVGPTHDDVTIEGVARAMDEGRPPPAAGGDPRATLRRAAERGAPQDGGDARGRPAGRPRVGALPDDPDAQRLHPAGSAGDLPPQVRVDPRAVPRPAHPPAQRVRGDRRGHAGRAPERAAGGFSLAAAGVIPRALQPRVQGEG